METRHNNKYFTAQEIVISLASIECSIKFHLSCYSTFTAWFDLELVCLVVKCEPQQKYLILKNGGKLNQLLSSFKTINSQQICAQILSNFRLKQPGTMSIDKNGCF